MSDQVSQKAGTGFLAGMKVAKPILVPFLLAAFLTIVSTPFLIWLKRIKVPNVFAVLIILAVIIFCTGLVSTYVGSSLIDFTKDLPSYEARLDEEKQALMDWLDTKGIVLTNQLFVSAFEPKTVMKLVANTFAGLGGVLTNTVLILITMSFMLLEISGFPAKLAEALGQSDADFPEYRIFMSNLNRYMALKTLISFATGIVVTIFLMILGIDYAVLWGVLAFFLNFIPSIGSIIAAVPVVLLGYVQLGQATALIVALGYLVINILIGQVIEPRVMGRGMNLSTLVVFLSLVIWGWVLGPVGMFLSVPLTMTLKIALESRSDTRWISVMLGSDSRPQA